MIYRTICSLHYLTKRTDNHLIVKIIISIEYYILLTHILFDENRMVITH
ncbi:unnamed protein product [Schistosoma mattheei]|uniref:Uncharacterized protein n=1 Tax=Schistosoma mattheei TaxID=31246 RepID=A0A183P6N0_9TREM|nr:unnamed protein product [Schistosoma mattheei]